MDSIQQILPCNIQAEQELLGAILNNSESILDAIGIVDASDFHKESHKFIFSAMEKMFKSNIRIDIVTLAEELRDVLPKVGGITYISELSGSIVNSNVKEYSKIIKEKSNKRKIIKTCELLRKKSFQDTETSQSLVDEMEEQLFKISLNKENKLEPFNKVLESTITNIEDVCKNKDLNNGVTGIDTGFKDLNRRTGGLQKQDLIILAARPSMGKTTLAVNIATSVSKNNTVAIFSLEMSKEQITRKILAGIAHIDLSKINTGNLDFKDWGNIGKTTGPLSNNKLFIDDSSSLSVTEIKAKCKRIKMQHGLSLVIVDYLQLITSKGENRTQEISNISRALKRLAKELDVPLIALSQLSRAVEAREDHRPRLSDLRESGSLEQDADIVMFLYRDEYYHKETEEKNIAEVIFAKNRNGKVGTIKLAWLGQYQKFGQLEYVPDGGFNPDIFEEKKEPDAKQEVMKIG
ncbi:replicative DNA helicase [Clostridium sp. WILCCON 0269]|uniref:Replicative DNA helicase n=1 Tax=Candidatus Clostridium eludens TaxID=3381663 RepID=A0ABW8SLP1_9CLOT